MGSWESGLIHRFAKPAKGNLPGVQIPHFPPARLGIRANIPSLIARVMRLWRKPQKTQLIRGASPHSPRMNYGPLAQRSEQQTHNLLVRGSNPRRPTSSKYGTSNLLALQARPVALFPQARAPASCKDHGQHFHSNYFCGFIWRAIFLYDFFKGDESLWKNRNL